MSEGAFDVGHRVVVKGFPPDDPDPLHWSRLVGHYGHVRELLPRFVIVDIEGSTTGQAYQPAIEFAHGWAFYPEELEHVD
jgi:hypothetical protein